MNETDNRPSSGPYCVVCGARMQFARSFPRFGANPELISYVCARCGHVVTRAEKDAAE